MSLGIFIWLTLLLMVGFIIRTVVVAVAGHKEGVPMHWFGFHSLADFLGQAYLLIFTGLMASTLLSFNTYLTYPISEPVTFLVAVLVAYWVAYYFSSKMVLLAALFSTIAWWLWQVDEWNTQGGNFSLEVMVPGLLLLGTLFFLVSYSHKKLTYEQFVPHYGWLGYLLPVSLLFILSSSEGLSLLAPVVKNDLLGGSISHGSLYAALGFFLGASIALSLFAWKSKKISGLEQAAAWLPVVGYVTAYFLFKESYTLSHTNFERYSSGPLYENIWVTALFNVLLLAELVGLLLVGYYQRHESYINMAAFLLFIFVLAKYFDWFFQALDKSLFFILAGLLLFGLGWFMERGRKMVVASMYNEEEHAVR